MCCGWWREHRGKDTPGSKATAEQGGGAPSAVPTVRLPSCDLERNPPLGGQPRRTTAATGGLAYKLEGR